MKSYRRLLTGIIAVSLCSALGAKEKKGVIMTVDGEEIPTEEFIYLFKKNNQQQSHPQSLEEYLDLFEAYRLKVAEAKREGVDTTSSFKKEMNQYRRELLEPYINDTVFFNRLVDIAAEREMNEVESSHIMIIRTHDAAKDKRNLEILDSLRTELLNGADFISIAKIYSQDKFSSDKGGYLGFNPVGTFPYGFETAVYDTPEGEISEIVESHVGWHIVKSGARKPALDFNRPVKTREEIRADVMRKSSSPFDSRFHEIKKHKLNLLKNRHKEMIPEVENLSDDEAYEILLSAEETSQYASNPEYRNLVDEYVNGSLLYEVSVKNVWDKAATDEEGLKAFYETHKDNYKWELPHAKGILVKASNDSIANVIKEETKSLPSDTVVKYIRGKYKKEATADRFNVSKGSNPIIDYLLFGEEQPNPESNSKVYFVIDGRIVESPENLDDVRGLVISDYQEALETDWVNNLKQKHVVEINRKELSRVKKEL